MFNDIKFLNIDYKKINIIDEPIENRINDYFILKNSHDLLNFKKTIKMIEYYNKIHTQNKPILYIKILPRSGQ